ncbi:MAG: hypothetical protein IJ403_04130 [Oscillospiraceae bacterium]|nr:hypothetical protein [Oscillospiraceae bacterium]
MANWNYNPSEYSARNFEPIPEGDYRVRINNVKEKIFSTGNEGFEITLEIPGQVGKLWYYLVLEPSDSLKTNQRLGMFFDSFAICDTDLNHYSNWIGRDGAVRVKHSVYNGTITSRVVFCLSRSQQKKFLDYSESVAESQNRTVNNGAFYCGQQNKFPGFNTPHREIPSDMVF